MKRKRESHSKSSSYMPVIMIGLLVVVSTVTVLVAHPFGADDNTSSPTYRTVQPPLYHSNVSIDENSSFRAIQQTSPPKLRIVTTTTKPEVSTPIPIISPNSPLYAKNNGQMYNIHFIHVPKCGGTTMTAALRQVMCELDRKKNHDCCTNPGFCDHNSQKRCSVIKGCINHFPNRCVCLIRLSLSTP